MLLQNKITSLRHSVAFLLMSVQILHLKKRSFNSYLRESARNSFLINPFQESEIEKVFLLKFQKFILTVQSNPQQL